MRLIKVLRSVREVPWELGSWRTKVDWWSPPFWSIRLRLRVFSSLLKSCWFESVDEALRCWTPVDLPEANCKQQVRSMGGGVHGRSDLMRCICLLRVSGWAWSIGVSVLRGSDRTRLNDSCCRELDRWSVVKSGPYEKSRSWRLRNPSLLVAFSWWSNTSYS